MTTLVALATKDSVVMGCDSLATISKPLVDPLSLVGKYFDQETLEILVDEDGASKLKSLVDILSIAQQVPYNHMSHVQKLMPLGKLPAGVMVTGVASIGDRTVRSLLTEFCTTDPAIRDKENYTIRTLSQRLYDFVSEYYTDQFSEWNEEFRPELELMVGGYGRNSPYPSIYRITFPEQRVEEAIPRFGIAFGGQMQEIQRLVFGTDFTNRLRIERRYGQLLSLFSQEVAAANDEQIVVPDPQEFAIENGIFSTKDAQGEQNDTPWMLSGLSAQWSEFSEQNAIDCVNFLLKVMIEAQRFNTALPTVGGDIHIGLITREDRFRWISREEYRHEQHRVPRNQHPAEG